MVETCPYTIRRGNDVGIPTEDERNGVASNSRDKHEDQRPNTDCNTTNGMEEVERESQYDPWMVVARKRYGSKSTKKDLHVSSMPSNGRADRQRESRKEGGIPSRGLKSGLLKLMGLWVLLIRA